MTAAHGRRAGALDAVVALALIALGLAEVLVPLSSRQGHGSAPTSVVGVVVLGGALVLRRRRPLAVAAVVLVGWTLLYVVWTPYVLFYGTFVPIGVATYSVARWGTGREPYVGAGLGALTLVGGNALVPQLRGASEVAFDWGVCALAWGAGFAIAAYQRRAAAHLQRAIDAEVDAASRTMAALVEERTRIARELHDIVAHSVSMIVVQAGAAEQMVREDPDYVATALGTIRQTGTGALGEMRRVVSMLRDADGELAPQPGVDGVPDLVEEARRAGLDATLEVRGTPRDLPVGLELAAYRIVQEALTNVRRHAAASTVRVVLVYGADDVRVEVVDDGVGPERSTSPVGGHGLIGMKERASIYGGRLETGPAGERGYAVRAVLPAPA